MATGTGEILPPAGTPAPQATGNGQILGGSVENIPTGAPLVSTPETQRTAQSFSTPITTKLSPGEVEYQKGAAKNFEQYEKELNTTTSGLNRMLYVQNEAREALKGFQSGGGQSTYETMARAAQSMGASQRLVDTIARGNLGAIQEFQKLMVQQATFVMTSLLKGGGRFTNAEFLKFQENNPNVNMDPRAIERIFDFNEKQSRIIYNEQEALSKFKKLSENNPNMKIHEFPAWWNKQLRKAGVLGRGMAGEGEE